MQIGNYEHTMLQVDLLTRRITKPEPMFHGEARKAHPEKPKPKEWMGDIPKSVVEMNRVYDEAYEKNHRSPKTIKSSFDGKKRRMRRTPAHVRRRKGLPV